MATKQASIYKTRLMGSTRGGIWLADDHLLVSNSVVSMFETYRRFYFTDIQAIVMQPSVYSLVWRWVKLLCSIPLFLLGLAIYHENPFVSWQIVMAPFLLLWIFLAFYTTRHKSCRCELRTFTQTFDLSSVVRNKRQFERLLEAIEPKIRDCQGSPSEEDLAARAESWNQDAQTAAKVHRERQRESQQRAQQRVATTKANSNIPSQGKRIVPVWHWIGVGGVSLLILVNLVGLSVLGSPVMKILLALFEVCTVVAMVGAVVHQLGSDMPRRLQAFPWFTLSVQLIAGCAAVVLFFMGLSNMHLGGPDTALLLAKRLLETFALAAIGVVGATDLVSYIRRPVAAPAEPEAAEAAARPIPGAPPPPPVPLVPTPEGPLPPASADDSARAFPAPAEAPPPGEPPADPDQPRD